MEGPIGRSLSSTEFEAGDVLTERTVGSTEKSPGSHVTLARELIGTHRGTGNRREEGTLDGEHGGISGSSTEGDVG